MEPGPVSVRLRKGVPDPDAVRVQARRTATALQAALAFPVPVRLTVTDNVRSMISARRRGPEVRVSVHWCVVGLTDDVVAFLAHRDRSVLPRIEAAYVRTRHRSQVRIRTSGNHHDLAALSERVRLVHFPDAEPVEITWGRRGRGARRARRRSMRLGSRDPTGLVRVHPVLDDPSVPAWFLGFLIFHEVLHGVHRPERLSSGRRSIHTRAFKAAERAHPDFARATAWRREHLSRLLDAR